MSETWMWVGFICAGVLVCFNMATKNRGGVTISMIATVAGLSTVVQLMDVDARLKAMWGIGMFVALMALFFCNALREIPANPPHKAVVTFWGKRQNEVLDEGYRLLPFYPLVFGYILVKTEKVNQDLGRQQVRTMDGALVSIEPSITWVPGIKDNPGSLITFLDSGGEEKVRKILSDRVKDRTKTWAGSSGGGPVSWKEALVVRDDIYDELLRSILGDAFFPVPERLKGVPVSTLLRFFDGHRPEPTEFDVASGWATKVDDSLGRSISWKWTGLEGKIGACTPPERQQLEASIKACKENTQRARNGLGRFGDESLGITIVQFTVNQVTVEGGVAETADKAERERRQGEAERIELANVCEMVTMILKAHSGMTVEKAFDIVQSERRKAKKWIFDFGLDEVIGEIRKRFSL